KARLIQWRLAIPKFCNDVGIVVDADSGNADTRHAGGGDGAEMPEAEDGDFHTRSITQRFCDSQSTVRTMPSRIVSFGRQPSVPMRAVSRKMKLLSPIHPREPPE